jgi:ubiquinone/menaquinone biosynthesis C-methylase UbiE
MRFEIGCGNYPAGDVNCDLYPQASEHRDGTVINTKRINNFVRCDAQHLPFKDNCFTTVASSHTIEHVENPFLMLKEMYRVSKRFVRVRCPHRIGERMGSGGRWLPKKCREKIHINPMNKEWLYAAAAKLGMLCCCKYSKYVYFPHEMFPIIKVPFEVSCVMRVNKKI